MFLWDSSGISVLSDFKKRYWVFAGTEGIIHHRNAFDSIEEAEAWLDSAVYCEWGQILDRLEGSVWKYYCRRAPKREEEDEE